MNRRSLIVDVHEPGDADNAVGMVRWQNGGTGPPPQYRVTWRCLLCQAGVMRCHGPWESDSLGEGLEGLLEHLEAKH